MKSTQINVRNMRRSAALSDRIRQFSAKLEEDDPRIMHCRVAVEALGKRHSDGRHYAVSVNVHLPGHDFVANRHEDEDVYVAVRDAFAAVSRQLEESRQPRH
jgi:ribosome-associated translation inhibitor RaiA